MDYVAFEAETTAIVADAADVVDLDGPLLIGADRINGLVYDHGWVHPPERELWG